MSGDESKGTGRLYIVSTPIGNLGDFSFRAVETLRSVAAVLAEDTRHSRTLLDRYEIRTPLVAHHEHNEAKSTPALISRLESGEDLALITDAGTPLLSDPGARLVRAAVESGIQISAVPGASALLAGLVVSGIEADQFTFLGFLPRSGKARGETIADMVRMRRAVVFYEAPNRVGATLADLAEAGASSRQTAVARELTKLYEEVRRGTVEELAAYYEGNPPRGEVVIVMAGLAEQAVDEDTLRVRARELRGEGRSARDAARALVEELGAPRNVAYRIAHEE